MTPDEIRNHILYDTSKQLVELRDGVRDVLRRLDELADIWGDEAQFKRCRDRLRELAGDSE